MNIPHPTSVESTLQRRENDHIPFAPYLPKHAMLPEFIDKNNAGRLYPSMQQPIGVPTEQSKTHVNKVLDNINTQNGRYANILPKPSTLSQDIGMKFDPTRVFDLKTGQLPVPQSEGTQLFGAEGPNGRSTSVCNTCGKWFRSRQQLTQHMLVHSDVRKYRCTYCGRAFKQPSHLQQHHRIHTGEKPYKCTLPGCNRAFPQLSNLNHHLRNHDKPDPPRENTCSICDRVYASETVLRNHVLKIHMMSSTDEPKDKTNPQKDKQENHQNKSSNETGDSNTLVNQSPNQYPVLATTTHAPTMENHLRLPVIPIVTTTSNQSSTIPGTFQTPLTVPVYTNGTLVVSPPAPVHPPLQITTVLREEMSAGETGRQIVKSPEARPATDQVSDQVHNDTKVSFADVVENGGGMSYKNANFGRLGVLPQKAQERAIFNTIPLARIRQCSDTFIHSGRALDARKYKMAEERADFRSHHQYVFNTFFDKEGLDTAVMNTYYTMNEEQDEYDVRDTVADIRANRIIDDTACLPQDSVIRKLLGHELKESGDVQDRDVPNYAGPYNYTLDDAHEAEDDVDSESASMVSSTENEDNRLVNGYVDGSPIQDNNHFNNILPSSESGSERSEKYIRESVTSDQYIIETVRVVNETNQARHNVGHNSRKRKAFQPQRFVSSFTCSE